MSHDTLWKATRGVWVGITSSRQGWQDCWIGGVSCLHQFVNPWIIFNIELDTTSNYCSTKRTERTWRHEENSKAWIIDQWEHRIQACFFLIGGNRIHFRFLAAFCETKQQQKSTKKSKTGKWETNKVTLEVSSICYPWHQAQDSIKVDILGFSKIIFFFTHQFTILGKVNWKWKIRKILTPYGVSTRTFFSKVINF